MAISTAGSIRGSQLPIKSGGAFVNTSVDQRAIRNWHSKAMIPVLGGVTLVGMFWKPDLLTQIVILCIGVATLGLGHGALDHRVGEILLRPKFDGNWLVVFTTLYLMLAAIGFALWVVTPSLALIVFLAYSAFHFGSDRFQPNGAVQVIARGAMPLLLPIACQPAEVSMLFSTITATSVRVEQYAVVAGILVTIAVLVTILSAVRRRESAEVVTTVLLVVLNLTMPPLIGFTMYFVLLHSVRHIIELAGWLEPTSLATGFRRIARESLPITGLLILAGVLGISFAPVGAINPTIIQTVFIGLSCLTVPHMVVTYLAENTLPRRQSA